MGLGEVGLGEMGGHRLLCESYHIYAAEYTVTLTITLSLAIALSLIAIHNKTEN